MAQDWIDYFVDVLNGSPTMQVLFMVLVVLGRFALDRWERNREREARRRRKRGCHG